MTTTDLKHNINEAAKLYKRGATSGQVGSRYGVSEMTALKYLREHGVAIRKPGQGIHGSPKKRLTLEQENDVVGRYRRGATTHALAVEIGVSQSAICGALERHGVSRRSHADYRDLRIAPEKLAALHERYLVGESIRALAKETDYAESGLRELFRSAGLKFLPRARPRIHLDDSRVQKALSLWDEGLGFKRAATQAGIDEKTMRRFMRETDRDPLSRRSGPGHPLWKGGRWNSGEGYIRVWVAPDDPFAAMGTDRGYVLEHRLVMARSLGRPLLPTETVHHKNGKRDDNRTSNLQLRSGRHGKGQQLVCADCGSTHIVHADLG